MAAAGEQLAMHGWTGALVATATALAALGIFLWAAQVAMVVSAPSLRHIPGPRRRSWLLGHLPDINESSEWGRMYGPVCKYFLGPQHMVLVHDPDVVHAVCVKGFHKAHDRFELTPNELTPWMLLFSKGAYWQGIRSTVLPLFHTEKLASYSGLVSSCLDRLLGWLERAAGQRGTTDISLLFHKLGLDAIGTAVFGADFLSIEGGKLVKAANVMVETFNLTGRGAPLSTLLFLVSPTLGTALRLMLEYIPGTPERRGRASRDYIINVMLRRGRKQADTSRTGGEPPSDFLTYLRTKARVQAEAFEFLMAGSETVAISLSGAIFLLSKNPEAERKLLDEIDGVSISTLTLGDLSRFPYTTAVMKETLRLLTPAPNLLRKTTESIDVGRYHLPKGTRLLMDVYNIHRLPELYTDPLAFRPERWLPGNEHLRSSHPCSYIPFGAGPRMCVGYKFGQLEIVMTLVKLYKRFTFKLCPAQSVQEVPHMKLGITLSMLDGINVQVNRRDSLLPKTYASKID
eukprot:SM000118S25565  [mRNA]  locus=s118:41564:44531:+ [translate_table: standard]